LRVCAIEEIAWFTVRTIRFGGSHLVSQWSRRGGRCLPAVTCANRASDDPCRLPHGGHAARAIMHLREGRQDDSPRARVKRSTVLQPSGVSSIEQGPSPRNALSSARLWTSFALRLCHRDTSDRRLFTPSELLRAVRSQSPVHAFRCHRRRASLRLGEAYRLLQPFIDARAHPTSVRPSHASEAFAPLLAGTNRCRLRWYPRGVAAMGTCEPPNAPEVFRLPRSTCVDEAFGGPMYPSKGMVARFVDESRVPSSSVHRAPGSPNRFVVRSG